MTFDVAVILIVGAIIISALIIANRIGRLGGLLKKAPMDDVVKTPADASSVIVPATSFGTDTYGEVVAAITAAVVMMGEADGVVYQVSDIMPAEIPEVQDNRATGKKVFNRPVWMQAGIVDNTNQF